MFFKKGEARWSGLYTTNSCVCNRVPRYSSKTLTEWYQSPVVAHLSLLFHHLTMRVHTNLELLEETDIVTKTASV